MQRGGWGLICFAQGKACLRCVEVSGLSCRSDATATVSAANGAEMAHLAEARIWKVSPDILC
jgi:hypothetical protein